MICRQSHFIALLRQVPVQFGLSIGLPHHCLNNTAVADGQDGFIVLARRQQFLLSEGKGCQSLLLRWGTHFDAEGRHNGRQLFAN